MVNVTPKQLGKNIRMSFGKITEPLEMPNLIEVQKNSYQWFREEGLREVFRDMTLPIITEILSSTSRTIVLMIPPNIRSQNVSREVLLIR